VLVAYRHRGFAVPRLASLSRVTTFTANILVTRISWYLYANADFVIVGRVLGVRALGTYKMAWNVSTAPIQKIVEIVTRVTPAVFSAVQRDHAALRRYVLVITEALATITFPASVGITLVAGDLVRVALGPAWIPAILPLRLLAAYVALRTISTIPSQVLIVTGDTDFTMKNGIRALVVMPAAFLIGSFWGAAGVAAAWIVAYPTIIVPVYLRLFRRIELPARSYLAAVVPATSGTVAMALAVAGARLLLSEDAEPLARLATQLLVGVAVYAGWVFGLHRARIARLVEGVRRIRG
jgi:PST family polysaccharide transporter